MTPSPGPSAVGVAGRLADAFVDSKLTPLFITASLLLGALAVVALPREEEPQIVVPMVDVQVELPGASAKEVEYVYSTSSPGATLIVVRFYVGEDEEAALVRVHQELGAVRWPSEASPADVRLRSIDDVPVVALTLSSARYDEVTLRQVAAQLHDALKEVPDVSEVTLIGGRRRVVSVQLDPARLESRGLDALSVRQALETANARRPAATVVSGGTAQLVEAGSLLQSPHDVASVPVPAPDGHVVRLSDVATVVDGADEPTDYVAVEGPGGSAPAVTLAVAKRRGANATVVAERVVARVGGERGRTIPSDVAVTITRDYGRTAADKSNELLWHMFLAVVSVSVLIGITLGRREAVVVLVAIPVTLSLTLFVFYGYGYTLNRITLFALIFSIGILVDDAIVVVENIVRHLRLPGSAGRVGAAVTAAVDEVGGPTILATLTVVAAILPMAFVGGLMGPYMRPIPVGASAAMLFSLLVAFVVTPWAARRLLAVEAQVDHGADEGRLTALYRRVMSALIASSKASWAFLVGVVVLLLAAAAFVPLGLVTVKMLPFDNKSEFQVLVDMPEGTTLETTDRVTRALSAAVLADPAVRDVQRYVGTASPYNFNGLVRHYYLRGAAHQGDLQVNLVPADERSDQSHAIATRLRERLMPIAERLDARIQVAEVPPGPPVLQTLVAEIYGPEDARRQEVAAQVRDVMQRTAGVVDVDWYVEDPQAKVTLEVDREKAVAAGVQTATIAAAVQLASAGMPAGLVHDAAAREDVPILLRLPKEARDVERVRALRLPGAVRASVGELTRAVTSTEAPSIYHKNMRPVTYVIGDLAGAAESPVYAILQMNRALAELRLPEGYPFEVYSTRQPDESARYAMKWDGEWHITYEVFRDLGLAFAAVLVLIYVLVVGWFKSFLTPLTIMAAIPFSLVGILPAHAALGAFFTATSMIGFIAGAGIVVRNSIILVDFVELRLREGLPLAQAVVDAGAVRFRPMALTAAAVVVGATVILFDPIFQGLAISLMAGEVASLLLSRVTVPVLYYLSLKGEAS